MKKISLEKQQFNKEVYGELTELEVQQMHKEILDSLENNIKCVVPVSGGKDSQSCLELAVKHFGAENVLGMFCDTGYEHPLTYQHIEKMKVLYGVDIIKLQEGTVQQKVLKHGRFPSDIARFCTDQLKISVGKKFYKSLCEWQLQQGYESGFEVWYGMRLGESFARSQRYAGKDENSLYTPIEILPKKYPKYLGDMGVRFKLPIVKWEEEDVYDFLGDSINQLYKNGFDRVGCFPCLASGDRPKERAFSFDDVGKERRIEVIQLGQSIGKNVFTSKGGRMRNPDTDPDNMLDFDYNPNQEEDAPCFHCNI